MEIISREFIYIWYYFSVQLHQIFSYWVIGMIIGSVVSVFFKDKIHGAMRKMNSDGSSFTGIVLASMLGVASPLCMYGTIPIAASFSKSGIRDEWLAAFMMSSILLNPQLIIYSAALGLKVLFIRIVTCFLCGISAGVIIRLFYKKSSFFTFASFDEPKNKDTDPNLFMRFLKNLYRNVKATGGYFLVGVLLSAMFQRYIPQDAVTFMFGGNEAWGVLMASTIGVPLYVCGGGTIPILRMWLENGMSLGSAAAFMITGPATKITNLGALKVVLGIRHFIYYWLYVILFSVLCGLLVNILMI
ncbi:MAG: permease [Lachnospiraceae bacterium]|nr:permease [Lachnospiraceae bacterium]MCR4867565.1 permease [Lachnospiraceae bacterium]